MPIVLLLIPVLICTLWLLSIRPYCLRNREGHTPGANIGVTLWVDWQQAGEIARKKGDDGMIFVYRLVFWLHVAFASILLLGVLSNSTSTTMP